MEAELEQVPPHASPRIGQRERPYHDDDGDDGHRRQHDCAHDLDALAHALHQHDRASEDHDRRARELEHERLEDEAMVGRQNRGGVETKLGERRDLAHRVPEHPADDGRVVAGGRCNHKKEEPPDIAPKWKAAALERAHGSAPRVAAEREFGHQRRDADDHRHEHVEEDERSAAELSDHVRKAPHVAEPDGHADDGQQPTEPGGERLAARRRGALSGRG